MTTIRTFAVGIAFTATAVFANDQLAQMRDHARELESEFRGLHTAVKAKSVQEAELRNRLEAAGANVDRLKAMAEQVEASHAGLVQGEDWKRARQVITLLDIFHDQKEKLVADGIGRNRGLIKAHAEGLAKRAAMLHESMTRMLGTAGGA